MIADRKPKTRTIVASSGRTTRMIRAERFAALAAQLMERSRDLEACREISDEDMHRLIRDLEREAAALSPRLGKRERAAHRKANGSIEHGSTTNRNDQLWR